MPRAVVDGIDTEYAVAGAGPPLLMFSPGGFDATADKWRTQGIYSQIKPLDHLAASYTCIVFDRRECGASGGRVEAIGWNAYAAQGKALLDHLGVTRAHVMGACMGCGPALALGVAHPGVTASLVLYWPVGGVHYRRSSHVRFAEHIAFVREHGLEAVAALVAASGKPFNQDTRGGPWASVIRRDASFAHAYVRQDLTRYLQIVAGMRDALFDCDTAPGASTDALLQLDVPALVVPGHDKTHATSAARYLEECLPRAEYWDMPVAGQTEATAPPALLDFLGRHPA